MTRNLLPAIALLLTTLMTPLASAGDDWAVDFKKALDASKRSGKPLLVDFTGSDWCTWCRLLDERVFAKDDFKAWAKDKVILVKLDFPSNNNQPAAMKKLNRALADRYKIKSYPSVLILDEHGKVHGKSGFKATPKTFIASVEKAVEAATRQPTAARRRDRPTAPNATRSDGRRSRGTTSVGLSGRVRPGPDVFGD